MKRTEDVAFAATVLGLDADATAAVSPFIDRQSLSGNSVVYYQEDPTSRVFLLRSGFVRLSYINENGMVTLLSMLPPGEAFGVAGAFDGGPQCDTAFTVGEVDLVTLDIAALRQTIDGSRRLTRALARCLGRRHRHQVDMTRALYLPNLSLRLSHTLLQLETLLGNQIRYKGQVVGCIGPIVTQQDLGSMARGTRENVNKTLRTWERAGIIALEDRHIVIIDRERLEDIAAGAAVKPAPKTG